MLIAALALMVLALVVWSEHVGMGEVGLIESLFLALVVGGSVERPGARCPTIT